MLWTGGNCCNRAGCSLLYPTALAGYNFWSVICIDGSSVILCFSEKPKFRPKSGKCSQEQTPSSLSCWRRMEYEKQHALNRATVLATLGYDTLMLLPMKAQRGQSYLGITRENFCLVLIEPFLASEASPNGQHWLISVKKPVQIRSRAEYHNIKESLSQIRLRNLIVKSWSPVQWLAYKVLM